MHFAGDRALDNGDENRDRAVGRRLAQPEVATDLTPLEPARFDLDLSNRVQERLLKEIERLEQRLADAEAERLELLEQVNHRDRLLTQIFRSRSWRWTQALRRSLGRR